MKDLKKCQDVMSPEQFVETRGDLIRMAYMCETPGMEEFREEIVNELQTGWLPDLLKLGGFLGIV